MKKIRLTESDLKHIIKESVKRIIKEEEDAELLAQYEAAKAKVKALKGKRDKKAEFFKAASEYQRLKELLGIGKQIINPSVRWSDEENERRGIKKVDGNTGWRKMDHLGKKKELDKDDNERLDIVNVDNALSEEKSGIHIDPKNKGKFTATKKEQESQQKN